MIWCGRPKQVGEHLSRTLQLAPTLLEATAGDVAGTVSHGAGAAIGSGAGGRVLAAEATIAGVVAIHHVAGAATANVIDGGGTAKVTLEFFVETEDGAFAAAVDIAGATTARGKCRLSA